MLVGACSPPAATPSPGPVSTEIAAASRSPTPRPTERSIPANPEGCPAPTEALSPFEFSRYGDECFPAGVTVDGWWERSADGSVAIGQRRGSVDARTRDMSSVVAGLSGDQTSPGDAGYGRFFSTSASPESSSIEDATYTPLSNPAMACPEHGPIPVGLFLQTLADCYAARRGRHDRAGWRDTLDGACDCGPLLLRQEAGMADCRLRRRMAVRRAVWAHVRRLPDAIRAGSGTLGPDSGLRPTYMEVSGHFDDPAAATCRAVADPGAPPEEAAGSDELKRLTAALRDTCANRFVATAVREVAPPTSALSFCPAQDPVPVAAVLAATVSLPLMERLCFAGGELSITGWYRSAAPGWPRANHRARRGWTRSDDPACGPEPEDV